MDDLLDLDWDKGPAPNRTQQVGTSQNGRVGGSSYNFDALTRSLPSSQPSTNNRTGQSSSSMIANAAVSATKQSNSDAFSSLLGFDSGITTTASSNISMAERLKREREQKIGTISSLGVSPSKQPKQATESAWEGLDSFLGGPTQQKAPARQHNVSKVALPSSAQTEDLWNFSSDVKTVKKAATPSNAKSHFDARSTDKTDPYDFSDFEDPGTLQSSALGSVDSLSTKMNPHRGTQLLGGSDDEGNDFMSSFEQEKAVPHSRERSPAFGSTSRPKAKVRAASPPPHILGQIVEMGFSLQQARQALAATSSGLDVSVAIEMLVNESGRQQQQNQDDQREGGKESDRQMALRLQREEEEEEEEEETRTGNRRRVDGRAESAADGQGVGMEGAADWQKQADQLYSQASEIGASMFNKANAFWSTAKAQAQRALEERNGGSSGQSSGRSSPSTGGERARNRRWGVQSREGPGQRKEWQGKPKWMIEVEEQEKEQEQAEQSSTIKEERLNTFRDDDDVDKVPQARPFVERQKPPPRTKEEPNLWDDAGDSSTAATGKSSRGNEMKPPSVPVTRRSSPLATSSPAPSEASSGTRRTTGRKAHPTKPVEKVHRSVVPDDAAAVKSSLQHKQRGNELFKRGAYGEAEVAYSNGLEVLQSSSIRRIALLNNRANARLKNGDARSALNDTKDVLTLIVVGENGKGSPFLLYRPSQEHPLPLPEYANIDLRDSYAKALLRRAQAEEMLEQWETAQSVWTLLERYEKEEGSGKSGMTNLRAAREGSQRCSKMVNGGDVQISAPASRRVHAAAIQAVAKAEKMARERIRSENALAAAEEAEKDRLRDSVDARILAWKGGKENNVRALLASLHDVVWPGLNWKKVGMHELVMDNQVKRCYMRAIGKLHPDKLTPKTNSIEERMVGGAVFSVLNDAWSSAA